MARVFAILRAVRTAFRRDWRSFGSLAGNNFFPISAFFLQKAGVFVYLIAILVAIFPMSTDPLRKIPQSRLDLWPLTPRERWALRGLSPWLNPMTWLLAAAAVWAVRGRLTIGLWAAIAGLFLIGFLVSELPPVRSLRLWRWLPGFPGPLNQLIRKNIREILSTLDFYVALLLSIAATAFRVARLLPSEGRLHLTLLILLALSSYSQCLFGLDGEGGLSRYRLLPLSGWKILAAKDAAFFAVMTVLCLPLAPVAAGGAALICAAIGHSPSVHESRPQIRWRFSTGVSIYLGFLQVLAMAAAGAAVEFTSPLLLLPCLGIWATSLWWFGRRLDEMGDPT